MIVANVSQDSLCDTIYLSLIHISKERHLAFLADVDSPAATAVRGFFETWDPQEAADDAAVVAAGEALLAGGNLVFRVAGREVLEDSAVAKAWDRAYLQPSDGAAVMRCV